MNPMEYSHDHNRSSSFNFIQPNSFQNEAPPAYTPDEIYPPDNFMPNPVMRFSMEDDMAPPPGNPSFFNQAPMSEEMVQLNFDGQNLMLPANIIQEIQPTPNPNPHESYDFEMPQMQGEADPYQNYNHDDAAYARQLQEEEMVRVNRMGAYLEMSAVNAGEQSHRVILVHLIVISCFGVMIYALYLGDWVTESFDVNPMIGPPAQVLLDMGAKSTELILTYGEYWRLVVPIFLHGGIIHLAANAITLLRVGVSFEEAFGFLKVFIIFFGSGIMGFVYSAVFLPNFIGVGASGAIYGIIGALFTDLMHNYKEMKEGKCCYLTQLLIFTAIGLAIGLFPLLDNFGHVGGFIFGFLAGGVVLSPRFNNKSKYANGFSDLLTLLSFILIIVYVVIGLYWLFYNMEGAAGCGWCKYISCIETPWWTCDEGCVFSQMVNGTLKSWTGPC